MTIGPTDIFNDSNFKGSLTTASHALRGVLLYFKDQLLGVLIGPKWK